MIKTDNAAEIEVTGDQLLKMMNLTRWSRVILSISVFNRNWVDPKLRLNSKQIKALKELLPTLSFRPRNKDMIKDGSRWSVIVRKPGKKGQYIFTYDTMNRTYRIGGCMESLTDESDALYGFLRGIYEEKIQREQEKEHENSTYTVVKLKLVNPPETEYTYELTKESMMIGRSRALCQIVIPDVRVSSHHLELRHTGIDEFTAICRTFVGVRVNGKLIEQDESLPLHQGDDLEISAKHYRFTWKEHIGKHRNLPNKG